MQPKRLVFISAVLTLLSIAVGLVTNIATSQVPDWLKPYLGWTWPVLLVLALLLVGLTVFSVLRSAEQEPSSSPKRDISDGKGSTGRQSHREDWDDAPDMDVFYGRQVELARLEQWMIGDHCRLVEVLGIGGIGKTRLAVRAAQQVRNSFERVIWRSLVNAPRTHDLLAECIGFLCDSHEVDLPESTDKRISVLIHHLQEKRCLIILDNVEAVLRSGQSPTGYLDGCQEYGELFKRVGEASHHSCMLLTSREEPTELANLGGPTAAVRTLRLVGLSEVDALQILGDNEVRGTAAACTTLAVHYAGNPLAIKRVSMTIRDLFGGDIDAFLAKGVANYGDVSDLLGPQFDRLSDIEKDVMYWLAIEREPIPLEILCEDVVGPAGQPQLFLAVRLLRRKDMIEGRGATLFTLQPVVMEHVTRRLIERVSEEIITGKAKLLKAMFWLRLKPKTTLGIVRFV